MWTAILRCRGGCGSGRSSWVHPWGVRWSDSKTFKGSIGEIDADLWKVSRSSSSIQILEKCILNNLDKKGLRKGILLIWHQCFETHLWLCDSESSNRASCFQEKYKCEMVSRTKASSVDNIIRGAAGVGTYQDDQHKNKTHHGQQFA